MTGPKPMRTEFGIHHRLESCEPMTSDAVVSFLQEFCLRKKFLQEVRNLPRILHLNVTKSSLITLKPMRGKLAWEHSISISPFLKVESEPEV